MKSSKIIAGTVFSTLVAALALVTYIGAGIDPATSLQTVEADFDPDAAITEVSVADPSSETNAMVFEATAYCDFGITYSGVWVQRGIVAADPHILPIGSVIEVQAGDYSGIYTVMDTGGVVKGRIIDIFLPDYDEAIQFGRQEVKVRVLRKGWDPEIAEDQGLIVAG